MSKPSRASRSNHLITGSSEMARRIREQDRPRNLAAIEEWSETLLSTANLMLHLLFPTILPHALLGLENQ